MNFTGERVVPDQMNGDILTLTEHLTRYVFALNFCYDKKVLDAACGTGYGLELISMVAKSVQGADIELEAIKYAKENYLFHKKPVNFYYCDFDNMELHPELIKNQLDVITSFETIEHLENPANFLLNCKKALADNGLFVFSIPNTNASKFHKQVYDFDAADFLIRQHFSFIEWHGQDEGCIGECTKDSKFFIGLARK